MPGCAFCKSTPHGHALHTHLTTHALYLYMYLDSLAEGYRRDYKAMNEAYSAWVDSANKPIRATVQSPMASPHMLVEIQVTAAVP